MKIIPIRNIFKILKLLCVENKEEQEGEDKECLHEWPTLSCRVRISQMDSPAALRGNHNGVTQ